MTASPRSISGSSPRTPEPDPVLLKLVLDEAEARGYGTSQLIWVDQNRNLAPGRRSNKMVVGFMVIHTKFIRFAWWNIINYDIV